MNIHQNENNDEDVAVGETLPYNKKLKPKIETVHIDTEGMITNSVPGNRIPISLDKQVWSKFIEEINRKYENKYDKSILMSEIDKLVNSALDYNLLKSTTSSTTIFLGEKKADEFLTKQHFKAKTEHIVGIITPIMAVIFTMMEFWSKISTQFIPPPQP